MDPFTEVRDSAGAVNHDPRGLRDPRPRSLSACGPPAASVARAHSERAAGRKPRGRHRPRPCFAAPSLALGKAGKTGPQKPHANPELCNRLAFLHSPKCWLGV